MCCLNLCIWPACIALAIIRLEIAGNPEPGPVFPMVCCQNTLFCTATPLYGRATLEATSGQLPDPHSSRENKQNLIRSWVFFIYKFNNHTLFESQFCDCPFIKKYSACWEVELPVFDAKYSTLISWMNRHEMIGKGCAWLRATCGFLPCCGNN